MKIPISKLEMAGLYKKLRNLRISGFILCAFLLPIFGNAQNKPNIILIYADDLGYGDIGINGAIGVKTPNIDTLAATGINFTDAHSPASTCTPSRYSLLTGQYAFRRKAEILPGDAPLLIDTTEITLPKVLKKAEYRTGVVGKWHLGLGNGQINWNERVTPGPAEVGFDYSFLIPSTGDRVPCVYLENQRVVGLEKSDPISVGYGKPFPDIPTGVNSPHLLKQYTDTYHLGTVINGISRIGHMKGGKKAEWVDEDFPFVLTEKANRFIGRDSERPFFLFFSLHDIHQPRLPNVKFIESSSMGPRGDVIVQLDWCVGEIVKQLRKLDIREKTLIIFTSDNGPVLDDGYVDYAKELVGEHQPGGIYRGTKYSPHEAGTRVPTIVNWPQKVTPKISNALVGQIDLVSSLASLVGVTIDEKDLDSENQLDAWLGKDEAGREFLLEESYVLGLRWSHWKYIQPTEKEQPWWITIKEIDAGYRSEPQLFDLRIDPGETNNLAVESPEVLKRLEKELIMILER